MAKTKAFSIDLIIDGKKKKITQTGIKTGAMRKVLKFYKRMEEIAELEKNGERVDELEVIDSVIILITEIFTNPLVDFDNVADSIDADEIMDVLENILDTAMGSDDSKKA